MNVGHKSSTLTLWNTVRTCAGLVDIEIRQLIPNYLPPASKKRRQEKKRSHVTQPGISSVTAWYLTCHNRSSSCPTFLIMKLPCPLTGWHGSIGTSPSACTLGGQHTWLLIWAPMGKSAQGNVWEPYLTASVTI